MVSGSEYPDDLLVGERNPGDIRLIKEAFSSVQSDVSIHTVTTGNEVREFIYQRGEYTTAPKPDVVLLNWNLPETDGREVLDDITTDFPSVSVVVMTGTTVKANAIEAETPQADVYMAKPSEPDVYTETIRSVD